MIPWSFDDDRMPRNCGRGRVNNCQDYGSISSVAAVLDTLKETNMVLEITYASAVPFNPEVVGP